MEIPTNYGNLAEGFFTYEKATRDRAYLEGEEIGNRLNSERIEGLPETYFTEGDGTEYRIRDTAVKEAFRHNLEELVSLNNNELIGNVAKYAVTTNTENTFGKLKTTKPVMDYTDREVSKTHLELVQIHQLNNSDDPNKYNGLAQFVIQVTPDNWKDTISAAITYGSDKEELLDFMGNNLEGIKTEKLKDLFSNEESFNTAKLTDYITQSLISIEDENQKAVATANLYLNREE